MTQDVEPVEQEPVEQEGDPSADDRVPQPTLLERARALWCQLVSGLG